MGIQDWLGPKGRCQLTDSTSQTLFVSRLADISRESAKQTKAAAHAKYLLFPEGMPIEALASRLSWLDIRNEHRLHVAHEQKTEKIVEVIYRMHSGIAQAGGAKPIVSQTEIDGLTDRHLRRIEQGQLAARTTSLEALARAHKMELSEYMNEIAKRLR